MFWMQFAVIIGCIILGAKKAGVTIGFAGGLGLFILVFIFGLRPSTPPVDVLLIMVAIGSMAATLQAAGGLDYLVAIAERILRRNPNHVTIVAPILTFFFTVFTGTTFVCMALFPVISEVAMDAKVRGERPMSMALVAALHGITASPVSASTAILVALLAPQGVTVGQVLLVNLPACFIGCMFAALSVYRRGLELEDDPIYKAKLESGELQAVSSERKHYVPTREAKISVIIFTVAVASIVLLGSVRSLLPAWDVGGKRVALSIPNVIEIISFTASCIMVLTCRIRPGKISSSSVLSASTTGLIAIFGIAWMTDTFFMAHKDFLITTLGGIVQDYPWLFALALFFMSALLLSQGATMRAMMPVGISLGLPVPSLVAMAPAVCGVNFLPTTGAAIATLAFDRSGTTRIGSFVLNHSFMRPGLVATSLSVAISFALAAVVF